jgi:hypothetical protein
VRQSRIGFTLETDGRDRFSPTASLPGKQERQGFASGNQTYHAVILLQPEPSWKPHLGADFDPLWWLRPPSETCSQHPSRHSKTLQSLSPKRSPNLAEIPI